MKVYAVRVRFTREYTAFAHTPQSWTVGQQPMSTLSRGSTDVALFVSRLAAEKFVSRSKRVVKSRYDEPSSGRGYLTSMCSRGFKRGTGLLPKFGVIYEIDMMVKPV